MLVMVGIAPFLCTAAAEGAAGSQAPRLLGYYEREPGQSG